MSPAFREICRCRSGVHAEFQRRTLILWSIFPCTDKDVEEMYAELTGYIDSVKNPYLNQLLHRFFDNQTFAHRFKFHSAAKSVHHGFVGVCWNIPSA